MYRGMSLQRFHTVLLPGGFALIKFEIKKTINFFLLTGDKFMPELHFKQPGFICSGCGSITIYCERI